MIVDDEKRIANALKTGLELRGFDIDGLKLVIDKIATSPLKRARESAGDNCMFSVPGDTGSPYAYCFMVITTAFALSP
jgi:hypothetical protein